jgi:hypothetical protein
MKYIKVKYSGKNKVKSPVFGELSEGDVFQMTYFDYMASFKNDDLFNEVVEEEVEEVEKVEEVEEVVELVEEDPKPFKRSSRKRK